LDDLEETILELEEAEPEETEEMDNPRKSKGDYSKTEFMKSVNALARWCDSNWEDIKCMLIIYDVSPSKFDVFLSNDFESMVHEVSTITKTKPVFGEFHRFHSWSQFGTWLFDNAEGLIAVFDKLNEIKYDKIQKFHFTFVKLLKSTEQLAIFKDCFSFCQDLFDFCYQNKGFVVEYLFEKIEQFKQKVLIAKKCQTKDLKDLAPTLSVLIQSTPIVQQNWCRRFQKAGGLMEKLLNKHYGPILASSFWQWSELANPRRCRDVCQKKLQNCDDIFKDWVVKYKSFLEKGTDLSTNKEFMHEWAQIFGSISVTELFAEGGVKFLKLYSHPRHTSRTQNAITTMFQNSKHPVPQTKEFIDKMKEVHEFSLHYH
jgi:hypothetical protein